MFYRERVDLDKFVPTQYTHSRLFQPRVKVNMGSCSAKEVNRTLSDPTHALMPIAKNSIRNNKNKLN